MDNFACILDPLVVLDEDDIDEMACVGSAGVACIPYACTLPHEHRLRRLHRASCQSAMLGTKWCCACVFASFLIDVARAVINETYHLFSDEEADALGWPYSHMFVGCAVRVL